MIFKRSKRPRFCFSNLSRNCIPVVCEKSAHHQLTWLPPEARRMSAAVLLSPFHELRYLIRGPARESLSHPSVLIHSLLLCLKKCECCLRPREFFQKAKCAHHPWLQGLQFAR